MTAGARLAGSPEAGSADAVGRWADAVRDDADRRVWQAGEVRAAHRTVEGQGATVAAVGERLSELAARWEELGAAGETMRSVLDDYANRLMDLQASARDIRAAEADVVSRAQRLCGIVLSADPTLGGAPWWSPPSTRRLREQQVAWELRQWHEAVREHDDLLRSWQDVVRDREHLDDDAVRQLDAIPELHALRQRVGGGGAGARTVAATLWASPDAIISGEDLAAVGDADQVRAVWDQLDDVQRRALISNDPMITGNLDGVPIQFRAEANRLNMRAEIARIDRVLKDVSRGINHPEFRDTDSVAELRVMRDELQYYLYSTQARFDRSNDPIEVEGVAVVLFDPLESAIATYRGPFDEGGDVPEWVANVVVHVPGTGTSLASFSGTDHRVDALYERTAQLVDEQGTGPTAIFAWAGGRFPQKLEAAENRYANDLGPRLRDFASAVNRHPAVATFTVTGHSYGAAVVGTSESAGLRADRILYVAGAGIGSGNTSVADFPHTGSVPHYSIMVRNDAIVGHIQGVSAGPFGHGAQARRGPGIQPLESGYLDATRRVPGTELESTGPVAAHSIMYEPGTTGFESIAQVYVGGRAEAWNVDTVVLVGLDEYRIESGLGRPGQVPTIVQIQ